MPTRTDLGVLDQLGCGLSVSIKPLGRHSVKVCSVCRLCYGDSVVSCIETGHTSFLDLPDRDPEMIAGYRLEQLAAGSTAARETYHARRIDCGRDCTVTIADADASLRDRFLNDARAAAELFNPCTADIYEAGSLESGELFVVAEDTGGNTLRSFLDAHGTPPLLTSIQIVRQATEALHALHLIGLIHRAICPENIVFIPDAADGNQIKLQNIDFGGVVEHSIVSNKFTIDDSVDSLRYFAPEQFSGAPASIKMDIYSLGIIFYEMLSGNPPFAAGKAADLIEMQRHLSPPEIKIDDFEVRMLVMHTLSESLQKRPEVRHSSANAFARQLRHIEQLAMHVSTPPPAMVVTTPTHVNPHTQNPVERPPMKIEAPVFQEVIPEAAVELPAHSPFAAPYHASRLRSHRRRARTRVSSEGVEPSTGKTDLTSVSPSEPTKIAWATPDDDIPSMAAVMEVRERERVGDTPAPEEPVVAVQATRIVHAVSDTPVPLAVLRFAARENAKQVRASQIATDAAVAPRETITRIHVRLEEDAADEASVFFHDEIEHAPETSPMFSTSDIETNGLLRNHRAGALAAIGLLAVAVLLVIWIGEWRASSLKNVGDEASIAEVTATEPTATRQISQPATSTAEAEPNEPQAETVVLPLPAGEMERNTVASHSEKIADAKTVPTKTRVESDVNGKAVAPQKQQSALVKKPEIKAPSVRSTLVIYTDNGRVKSKTESADRSGATRPRIVKNPKS